MSIRSLILASRAIPPLPPMAGGTWVHTSTNRGQTWTQQTNSGSRNWFDLAMSADGTKIYAADYAGYLYKSVG